MLLGVAKEPLRKTTSVQSCYVRRQGAMFGLYQLPHRR